MAAFRAEAREAIRAQVGKGRVICGLSGGVDSVGRGGADPRGDRRPAHLRVRRPRSDARGRGRGGRAACSATISTSRSSTSTPAKPFWARSTASPTPRPSARPSAACSSRPSSARRERSRGRARPRRIPGAGHALSRRDRERVVLRRPVGDDQVAPQCRRPARAHEHEARRAVARTVQGRGARARPRTRPARRLRRPPSVPRARASPSASPARSPGKSSTSCARPTRSISTRSARPASTTRSGRPSPCCCRCAPSA